MTKEMEGIYGEGIIFLFKIELNSLNSKGNSCPMDLLYFLGYGETPHICLCSENKIK